MALVCSNEELSIVFQEAKTLLIILPNSLALKGKKNYSSILDAYRNTTELKFTSRGRGNTIVELVERKSKDKWIKINRTNNL